MMEASSAMADFPVINIAPSITTHCTTPRRVKRLFMCRCKCYFPHAADATRVLLPGLGGSENMIAFTNKISLKFLDSQFIVSDG